MYVPAFTEELFGLLAGVDHVDRLTKKVCVDDVTCVGVFRLSQWFKVLVEYMTYDLAAYRTLFAIS